MCAIVPNIDEVKNNRSMVYQMGACLTYIQDWVANMALPSIENLHVAISISSSLEGVYELFEHSIFRVLSHPLSGHWEPRETLPLWSQWSRYFSAMQKSTNARYRTQ